MANHHNYVKLDKQPITFLSLNNMIGNLYIACFIRNLIYSMYFKFNTIKKFV